MNRTILFTVPGIHTDMEAPNAWCRRYASRFELEDETRQTGAPYLYYLSATAGMDDDRTIELADAIAGLILEANHRGDTVDLAAHSKGCRISLLALVRHAEARVRLLTLIAAAAAKNCFQNGLNAIAARSQARKVQILYSLKDTVLRDHGHLPGYGQLGLHGPESPTQELVELMDLVAYEGGHGDYFGGASDDRTYRLVTGREP